MASTSQQVTLKLEQNKMRSKMCKHTHTHTVHSTGPTTNIHTHTLTHQGLQPIYTHTQTHTRAYNQHTHTHRLGPTTNTHTPGPTTNTDTPQGLRPIYTHNCLLISCVNV